MLTSIGIPGLILIIILFAVFIGLGIIIYKGLKNNEK